MRTWLSNYVGNDIKNEEIDAKEDLEDVVIYECLLNVATFLSFVSKEKLIYVELNSSSLEANAKRKL